MKMKSILLSMIAMATLASCQKDNSTDNGGGGADIPVGEATYATFKFNVEGSTPGTRGAMEEQRPDETKVNDIKLLVFDGVALDGELLMIGDVNHVSQSATIATTSGPKRIFVVANTKGTSAFPTMTKGMKLSAFYALMSDKSAGTVPNPDTDMGAGFKAMLADGNMLMANVADSKSLKTLAANISEAASKAAGAGDANNHFTFNVKRSVAKGNLCVNIVTADIETTDGLFTFKKGQGDITYAVRNVNRSTNFIQQFVGGHAVTSDDEGVHALNSIRPTAPYYTQFDGIGNDDMKEQATYAPYYFNGYDATGAHAAVAGISTGGGAAATTTNVYFTENANKNQVRGNTSFFAIATQTSKIDKSKICDTYTFNPMNGQLITTPSGVDYTGTGDFWYIREIPANTVNFATEADKRYVFLDETKAWEAIYVVLTTGTGRIIQQADNIVDATALKAAYNAKTLKFDLHKYFGKYTGGVSYYRLDIYETIDAMKTKRHLVRRNHAYSASVTGFRTIGEPTEDDLIKNPEKPVDMETTHVTATITVQPWHQMTMEDEL